MKNNEAIVKGSMGSYLCPPNHPCHSFEVCTDMDRSPQNRGGMNLEYALTQEYVSDNLKSKIQSLLDKWEKEKPPIDSEDVKNWLADCNRHFANTNQGAPFIKKYYPEYNGV